MPVGRGQFFVKDLEPELATATANAEYQLVLASTGPGPNAAGPLLGLGAGAFAAEPTARTIAETGAALTLEPGIAQAMNEAFCKPIGRPDSFSAGETFGSISFAATAE